MQIGTVFRQWFMLFRSRVDIVFAYTWTTALGCLIAGNGVPPMRQSLLAIIASMFLCLAVYLYNDVVDREMDAYSSDPKKLGRPIAHGRVSVIDAMRFIYLCGLIGLGLTFLVNVNTFLLGCLYLLMMGLYSYPPVRFKRMLFMKSIVTSIGPPISLIIAGNAILDYVSFRVLFTAALQFILVFFMLPALADAFDIDEDSAFGMRTMGMVLSWRQKVVMMLLGVSAIISITLLTYSILGFSVTVPLLIAGYSMILLASIWPVVSVYDEGAVRRVRSIGYGFFLLIPLFAYLGIATFTFHIF